MRCRRGAGPTSRGAASGARRAAALLGFAGRSIQGGAHVAARAAFATPEGPWRQEFPRGSSSAHGAARAPN
eukprot:5165462-Pyramimonas_sp.AAC.1